MSNSTICVDSSLAIKLVLPENDSLQARLLWNKWDVRQTTLVAPSLWTYEVVSVIRRQSQRGKLGKDDESKAILLLLNLPILLYRPKGLHWKAWEMAQQLNHPSVYDFHYLALAEIIDCPFWTANTRFFNTVRHHYDRVHWLGNL